VDIDGETLDGEEFASRIGLGRTSDLN